MIKERLKFTSIILEAAKSAQLLSSYGVKPYNVTPILKEILPGISSPKSKFSCLLATGIALSEMLPSFAPETAGVALEQCQILHGAWIQDISNVFGKSDKCQWRANQLVPRELFEFDRGSPIPRDWKFDGSSYGTRFFMRKIAYVLPAFMRAMNSRWNTNRFWKFGHCQQKSWSNR